MPSPRHDAINQLFRNSPAFAVELLRERLGVDIPTSGPVRVVSNDFNDRPSKDFQPDTAIEIGPPNAPEYGLIIEVQQEKSAAKLRQLPRYAAQQWLMLRRPVSVLCVCPDADVAAYYADPIVTDLPGYVFRAAVLGPDQIPALTDEKEIAARPELATMSVMYHGRNRQVLEAFAHALKPPDDDHSPEYYGYAFAMAGKAVRDTLEEILSATWPAHSPFARVHNARVKAESILRVLAARRIEIPDNVRARIRECEDQPQLDMWLDRAAVATSINDVFDRAANR